MAQLGVSSLNTVFNFDGGAYQKVTPNLEECSRLAKKIRGTVAHSKHMVE